MSQIVVSKNIPDDLTKVICTLCIHIQEEYDISPKIINTVINSDNFMEYSLFIHSQCEYEMLKNIDLFESIFDPNSHENTDEYEKCGHLIESHKNTYVTYCNVHKYLHQHPDMPKSEGCETNHIFVQKSDDQIIHEKYAVMIHKIYHDYINKMYHMLKQVFVKFIEESCEMRIIKISDNTDKNIMEQMKKDETLFKNRMIYKHLDKIEHGGAEEKFYYIKTYKFVGLRQI